VSDTSRLKLFILRLLDAFTIPVFAKDVTFSSRQCIEQSLYTANHIWQWIVFLFTRA